MHHWWLISAFCSISVVTAGHVISMRKVDVYSKATVISTWQWKSPCSAAWNHLKSPDGSALTAIVAGCSVAEEDESIPSVGAGGSPDEDGNTTLSAMVMDGDSMNVGAVAEMAYIKEAAEVALGVLNSTRHTLLVGEAATKFAQSLGYRRTDLSSNDSMAVWQKWRANNCQPNFRIPYAWSPDPKRNCGPYRYVNKSGLDDTRQRPELGINEDNHDTIGVIALDRRGKMAVGLSTNGARFRIPGRVGDSPIPGAGGYADSKVGAAVGTGDGDVMMRFLLTFKAVELMRAGKSPRDACTISLKTVRQRGTWYGGLIALNAKGEYGAACIGFKNFAFVVQNDGSARDPKVISVRCLSLRELNGSRRPDDAL